MPGTLREVLDNYIAPRDKSFFNWLGIKNGKAGGLYMILKTGIEVAQ